LLTFLHTAKSNNLKLRDVVISVQLSDTFGTHLATLLHLLTITVDPESYECSSYSSKPQNKFQLRARSTATHPLFSLSFASLIVSCSRLPHFPPSQFDPRQALCIYIRQSSWIHGQISGMPFATSSLLDIDIDFNLDFGVDFSLVCLACNCRS